MLKSPAHKPFRLCEDIAEELGYLKVSDVSDAGVTNEPTVFKAPGRRHSCASELDPCERPNCACPRFEFTPPQHIIADSDADLESFTFLDGAAGSTLHGHRAGEDDDPENITLSYEKALPEIAPEVEEPYVRPPDSSDEDNAKWQKEPPKKPPRTCEDRTEMRKRFRKGKNKRAERAVRREENVLNSEKYFRPAPPQAERLVLDAYAAADEKLFGQKRFEEIEDDMKQQKEAIANWQAGIGMKAVFDDDPKKKADKLAQDIDWFIRDVLSEVGKQAEQERCDKAYKNKLFFEDTLEDVAIDHEFHLADQDQEKFRKAVGKKQNKELQDLRTEDIVDDISMDHNQQVGEKEEEHRRKTTGRIQNKKLTSIKTEDIVDNIAMDHNQQVGEKEEEHHRKTIGRIQSGQFVGTKMDDMVDALVMDHLQEVGEKEQEYHRKTVGRTRNGPFASTKMDDMVDVLAMGHLQRVEEKQQEHHRKIIGRHRNRELTEKMMLDYVENLAINRLHEVGKKAQENHRKTSETTETRKLKHRRGPDLVSSFVTDHVQEVTKNVQEQHGGVQRAKKPKLGDGREVDLPEPIAIGHMEDPEGLKQQYHRTKRQKTSLAAVGDEDPENGRGESQQHDGMTADGMDATVSLTATNPDQNSRRTVAKQKSNAFLTRHLATNEPTRAGHEQTSKTTEDNPTIPGVYPDQPVPEANRQTAINLKTPGPEQSVLSGFEAEVKNNQDDDDGYSSPAPAPKKDRRQLRKEANARFEAMMEEMVKAQEG